MCSSPADGSNGAPPRFLHYSTVRPQPYFTGKALDFPDILGTLTAHESQVINGHRCEDHATSLPFTEKLAFELVFSSIIGSLYFVLVRRTDILYIVCCANALLWLMSVELVRFSL